MTPLTDADAGERPGAVASVLIFLAVYAACIPTLGVFVTLALGWLPAAVTAVAGAHAVRFLFRCAARSASRDRLMQ